MTLAGPVGSGQILLDEDSRGDIIMEDHRYGTPRKQLIFDVRLELERESPNERVVRPSGGKGVGDVLKSNG